MNCKINSNPNHLVSPPIFAICIQIFTEDIPEVESLPRDKVLDYLMVKAKDLAIPYLEHIIHICNDETAEFHNKLIHLYREKVQVLMTEYIQSLPEGKSSRGSYYFCT